MSQGPGWVYRLVWDRDLRELARAEAEALGATRLLAPALVEAPAPLPLERAALVLAGGRVLAWGPPGGPLHPARPELAAAHVPVGPWRERRHPLGILGAAGWPLRHAPRLDPHQLFASEAGWFLTVGAPGGFQPLAGLPHRTSASLPAPLARAVVNLVARPGDLVLDPVCGVGTLLLEAARLGCRVVGADLNPRACERTAANLRAAGLTGQVQPADALREAGPPCDVVVGDLPYGRRLSAEPPLPLALALARRGRRWAVLAAEDLSEGLRRGGLAPRAVLRVPKGSLTRYVHLGGPPPR